MMPAQPPATPAPIALQIGEIVLVGLDQRFQERWTSSFQAELERVLMHRELRADIDPAGFNDLVIRNGSPESMGRQTARELARRLVQ